MFLIPEGFYVVCISLFEFGFGDAIIYFLLVGVMIGIHIYTYIYIHPTANFLSISIKENERKAFRRKYNIA